MRNVYYHNSFRVQQKQAIKAAIELCYSKSVLNKLKKCTTENELTRTLREARNDPYEWRE